MILTVQILSQTDFLPNVRYLGIYIHIHEPPDVI